MFGLKTIKRLFGGAFDGRHVDEFYGHRDIVDGFEICDFEEKAISHYAGPTTVRNVEPLRVRYVRFAFSMGRKGCSAWVYDPKECEADMGDGRYDFSQMFVAFCYVCMDEEKKNL